MEGAERGCVWHFGDEKQNRLWTSEETDDEPSKEGILYVLSK